LKDYSFLGSDGLSIGAWIPKFLRNLLPPALGYKNYLSAKFHGTIFKKSMILTCVIGPSDVVDFMHMV